MTLIPGVPERSDFSGPVTDRVFADASGDELLSLAEQLAAEMAAAWRGGGRLRAHELFSRHPHLLQSKEAAFRLITEEICLAQEVGARPAVDELAHRFPQWRTEIGRLLECHELLQTELAAATGPPGEILADFDIVAELGRGAQGRVVLARQRSLADRPLVLKISPREGREHLSLARLQHTYICPLYWVHDDPEKDQRILGMPFFGTVTLHDVLVDLAGKPASARAGQDLIDVLDRAPHRNLQAAGPDHSPFRRFLARESYPRAVTWMGSLLADALQYAHERDLVHLDLKPSNILLADDGQPMLLDFHLARSPMRADGPRPVGTGGTPQYMSPEQRALVTSLCEGKPIVLPVDHRSDIYSLGLILYQLLGGPVPLPRDPPPLDILNSGVSTGLADILHKCLEHHPGARYQQAGDLAADLRRHLSDQPLRAVANRSWKERWGKWRRRQPRTLPFAAIAAVLILACLVAGASLYSHSQARAEERLATIKMNLRDGDKELQDRRFDAALKHYARALKLGEQTSGAEDLMFPLRAQIRKAEGGRARAGLHALTDELRLQVGAVGDNATTAEREQACRKLWDSRAQILEAVSGDDEAAVQQVRADLLDLAIMCTDLRVRLAAAEDAAPAHRAALAALGEAETAFGSSAVLSHERLRHAQALGLKDQADSAREAFAKQPPRTAWEFRALGLCHLQEDDLDRAATLLHQAVAKNPHDFWTNFYEGVCSYRRGQYPLAVSAFRAAIAIQPRSAVAYFNRGLAHAKIPDVEQSLADYDRALALDSNMGPAALNRGVLHLQQRQYKQAESDLSYALARGSDPALTHYNLALVYREQNQRAAALDSVRRALEVQPDFKEARALERELTTRLP